MKGKCIHLKGRFFHRFAIKKLMKNIQDLDLIYRKHIVA